MIPTAAEILECIKLGFSAVIEICKVLQTAEGQKVMAQAAVDRKAWDSFWVQVGAGIQKFFKGELFK